jgi:Nif11 domain
MAVSDVENFLDRAYAESTVLDKVEAAKGADDNTTLANIVQLAATLGFQFTADEYRTTVQGEVQTIFKLHRAVPHFLLLTQVTA